jgi:hypothetical protein
MEVVDSRIPSAVQQNLQDTRADINLKINNAIVAASNLVSKVNPGRAVISQEAWDKASRWMVPYFVYKQLGEDVRPAVNVLEAWAMRLPQASGTAQGKIFRPEEAQTKYKDTFLSYDWFVAPVMKVDGFLVGTDKIGHFVEIGYLYFCRDNKGMMPDYDIPDIWVNPDGTLADPSETGTLGLQGPSGVYSNGDLAANKSGEQFYIDLWKNPRMRFDIHNYISDKWNEGSNPSYYTPQVAAHVWRNLLTGRWNGRVGPKGSAQYYGNVMSVVLTATADDKVSGTYSAGPGGSTKAGRLDGKIVYKADASLNGAITGIEIPFRWTEPGASGTGKWVSAGEDELQGSWGTDAAGTNRGPWTLQQPS